MNDRNARNSFLGSGLAFPLQMNVRGELAVVSGEKDIEQAIWIILGTRLGERVMRPTFGCRAYELVFEPINATTASLIEDYVREALVFWEPRIRVLRVSSFLDEHTDGAVLVEIEYEIRDTHNVRSIVYPFYLADNEETVED